MSEEPRTYDCNVRCCENRVTVKFSACDECKKEQPPHTCPLKEEIYNNTELCTCSRAAEQECAYDV